jgi:VWFA-related protein
MSDVHSLSRRELLVRTACAIAGNAVLVAQARPATQQPTFSGGVEAVNVAVTVRDKNGRLITDLSKEEFALEEDGRPQAIGFFSRESDLPLTVGLLVDTTPSESNMLDVERRASLAFLSRMLRPETDKAFIVQYYSEIQLLQGLTSKRSELEAALDRLEAHGFEGGGRGGGGAAGGGPGGGGGGRGRGGGQGPGGGAGPGGQGPYETVLADAVFHSAREILELLPGRKALLILGDGDHVGDRLKRAVTAAQGADTLIYPIRIYDKNMGASRGGPGGGGIRLPGGVTIGGAPGGMGGMGGGQRGGGMQGGPGGPGGGPESRDGKENLKQLAKQTGGTYFEVGEKDTLDLIYAKIEEELRSQYSLGYTPDANARDGFRTIKVSVKRKGMVVRAREGYYARTR